MENTLMAHQTFKSPIGWLTLTASENGIRELHIGKREPTEKRESSPAAERILKKARAQLWEYFDGKRKSFDLPIDLSSGTPFQVKAWKALARIPYGKTVSYQHQAKWLGKPRATRAVGTANGKNPIAIILPCHRVIGSNGTLCGYGGGLPVKKFLLTLEGAAFRS